MFYLSEAFIYFFTYFLYCTVSVCLLISYNKCGSDGRTVEFRTFNQKDGGSITPNCCFETLVNVTLPVSFGKDIISWYSLLSGVYARGSKRSHIGGKCATCNGLTNSRKRQL